MPAGVERFDWERVKKILIEKRYSVNELNQYLDWGGKSGKAKGVREYTSGVDMKPSIVRLGKIAEALGVIPGDLLTPETPLTLEGWRKNYAISRKDLLQVEGGLRTNAISNKADTLFVDLDPEIQNLYQAFAEKVAAERFLSGDNLFTVDRNSLKT